MTASPRNRAIWSRAASCGAAAVTALALALFPLPPTAGAADAVGAGRYENNSPAVSLKGPWTTSTSSQDSGGSFATLAADGYAELTFNTSAVKWIARTNSASGIAEVYIDGVKKATVDLYSATTKVQQVVFETSGLPEVDHVVRIVRTGNKNAASSGRNIIVDAIDVPDIYPPSAPPAVTAVPEATGARVSWTASPEADVVGYRLYRQLGTTGARTAVGPDPVTATGYLDEGLQPGTTYRYQAAALDSGGNESDPSTWVSVTTTIAAVEEGTYENDSSAVTLFGSWTQSSSTGANTDSGGSYATLSTTGYAEISFKTSGIQWLARTNSASGLADIYLDGVKKTTVDLYSATTKYKQVAYEIAGLSETNHTLRVVRTGTKNDASSGRNIIVDAFVAPDVHAPAAPTGVKVAMDGTAGAISWAANAEADVASYRVYRGEGSADPTTKIATTDADIRTFSDPGLNPGATYRYALVAVDTSGNASDQSAVATLKVPITAQGQGTYENDSPRVTLSGAWSTGTSAQDSGGSFATLGTPGYAEFSFKTSGIRWIARTNAVSGIADVYIDGVKKASVDLYSATTAFQQVVWEVTDLSEADHTIRVVRTGNRSASSGGANIILDAFVAVDSHPPAAPTGVSVAMDGTSGALSWTANSEPDVVSYRVYRGEGSAEPSTKIATTGADTVTFSDPGLNPGTSYRYAVIAVDSSGNASDRSTVAQLTVAINAQGPGVYENDSAVVTLNGPWTTTASNQDSGGSFSTLGTAGYAEMSFKTSGIRWIARTNSVSGNADVYIDGVKKTTVDLYSASTAYQQNVYEITGLTETAHTIRVVRTGTRNPASGGANIIVDAFVAPDLYPPAAPSGLRAVPEATGARATWTASAEADVIGYRLYRQLGTTGTPTRVGDDPIPATSYLDTGLQPGTRYRYQVAALDAGGNESARSSWVSVTTTINAVGDGTYENDSPRVTLAGPWSQTSSSQDSGGSFATLGTTGYAEISFKTSGLKWLARTNAYAGIADVYLDGAKVTSVDLYSPVTAYQQVVYEVTGLPEVDHTLRVVRTDNRNTDSAGTNVILDAFIAPDIHAPSAPGDLAAVPEGTGAKLTWSASPESDVDSYRVFRRIGSTGVNTLVASTDAATRTLVDPGLKPGTQYQYQVAALDTSDNTSPLSDVASLSTPIDAQGAGTYENSSSAVTLNGNWSTTASSQDSGGSFSTLSTAGYAELSFNTSGVKWIARTNQYAGIADVYIDGVKKASVDLYSATTKYQQVVYEISGLAEVNHTIRIVRTGAKNPSSGGGNVLLDAFNVPDIYPPGPPTGVSASPEATGARIGWAASPDADVVGYRIYRQLGPTGVLNRVTPDPVTGSNYFDDGLQPGTGYNYYVTAFDAGGNESTFSSPAPVTTNISVVGNGLYENDSPRVTLNGNWVKSNSTGANTDSGGSYATLNATGYAELSFNTSGVKWISRTNAFAGKADVYLDGVKKATVDLYSATTKYQQVVYEISGLPEVSHTIRIVRTGTRSATSGGSNIFVDAFSAPDIYAPSAPTAVTATGAGTGAVVSWTASPEPDTAGYQILRADPGASFFTLIGTTDAEHTSFADVGLADATTYRFRVVARDGSDNLSAPSASVSFTTPPTPPTSPRRYASCPTATDTVSTRSELVIAIQNARPGTVIKLNPGKYAGRYDFVGRNGTQTAPIWMCGPRTAVLDGGGTGTNNGIRVDSSSNIVVAGMTVRNSAKGITVIGSSAITVADTRVEDIGEEAIHLRSNTTDSTVIGNSIDNTGLMTQMYGEGVYIGTAKDNWCTYNNCEVDRSDRNTVILNTISNTTAEPIEAKEGATNGLITRNSINGTGMTDHADSLIAVQSNGWVVSKNSGTNSPLDGLQVWEHSAGWGMNNIAYANHFDQNVPGYAVRFPYNELGNVVGCDNTIGNPSWGVSNKPCQY